MGEQILQGDAFPANRIIIGRIFVSNGIATRAPANSGMYVATGSSNSSLPSSQLALMVVLVIALVCEAMRRWR